MKSTIQDQIDSNLSSPETSSPSLTDDRNERSCPDDFEDLFGRRYKEKGPDSMQQVQCFLSFPVSQSADENLQWPQLKDIFLQLNTPMPSSAASERQFSAASHIFLPPRSRINDSDFHTN